MSLIAGLYSLYYIRVLYRYLKRHREPLLRLLTYYYAGPPPLLKLVFRQMSLPGVNLAIIGLALYDVIILDYVLI